MIAPTIFSPTCITIGTVAVIQLPRFIRISCILGFDAG
jgi:hypothetical protein